MKRIFCLFMLCMMFIACDNYKEYRAERERINKEKAEERLRRREKERIEKEERSKTLIGGYIDKEGIYHFSFHENMNIEDFEDIEFVTLYDYNQQKYSKICDVCSEMKDFYEDEIFFDAPSNYQDDDFERYERTTLGR